MIRHDDPCIHRYLREMARNPLPHRFDETAKDRIVEKAFTAVGANGDKIRAGLGIIVARQVNGPTASSWPIGRHGSLPISCIGRGHAFRGAPCITPILASDARCHDHLDSRNASPWPPAIVALEVLAGFFMSTESAQTSR